METDFNFIKKSMKAHVKAFDDKSLKYPNRKVEIHKVSCKNCPTVINKRFGITDPEMEDTRVYSKEYIAKNIVFQCGWRTSKLCKGFCDEFEIDEEYLQVHGNKTTTT